MRNRYAERCNFKLFVLILFLAQALVSLAGCQGQDETYFQGYAEGDFVLVAAPLAGQLETLAVRKGDQVEQGAELFVLEHAREKTAVAIAEQDLLRAQSQLADLRKGQRPSELQALAAQLEKARAALELSEKEFARRQRLVETNSVSVEAFERARTTYLRDQAALAELRAAYKTAELGARSDAVAAAQAALEAVRGQVEQARWALEQKSQRAPQSALVEDTFYRPGEFVPAGYPVVSLLPPGNIKLRFFVPEPLFGRLQLGQKVVVSFDGSDGPLPAVISFISSQAEYTPPVIFSRETRAKLVFMIEARPDPSVASQLHPGQPVDVALESPDE
ncbi:HlyD family secretion protein [Malonomonas rubra DSM 5091]|uniref:HlyD family secretion protein n=1 Tax=Malonomonas rubra DSM 5091 TaxID=1122189 RepID=A0A1M6EB14_MALRU|nr:HlyD family efflux transporter periplasmic adaptor subunit [Malonomonas rubra]SHI82672.1 HlyD family secretion protein [Malonomonas rubra DSM 5091]